jgi:23S rRNA C2498 (ribose-2'-O)-methylase RlmM
MVLRWCYNGFTAVLQWCYLPKEFGCVVCELVLKPAHRDVTVVLQWFYSQWCTGMVQWRGVVLQWCYRDVTEMLQTCYSGVTMVLQGCYSGVADMHRKARTRVIRATALSF